MNLEAGLSLPPKSLEKKARAMLAQKRHPRTGKDLVMAALNKEINVRLNKSL